MLEGPEPVLAFERRLDGRTLRAYFNTAGETAQAAASLPGVARVLEGHGLVAGTLDGDSVTLPPFGALFLALD